MKSSIGIFTTDKFALICDGKTVTVVGTSPIAGNLRNIMKNPDSSYKMDMEDAGDSFDPVQYWALSSINFDPEIMPYSEDAAKKATEQFSNA